MEDQHVFLELINITLTSGVLILLIGAAVRYGQLTQKVDGLVEGQNKLWEAQEKLWTEHGQLDKRVTDHMIQSNSRGKG